MRKAFLILALLLALTLSGCSWLSNNSDDDTRSYSKDRTSDTDVLSHNDVRLVDVQVDGRTWIAVQSTCPVATQVGDGSCTVQVAK